MKYYNLKSILQKKATYNVIIGERSNGKTYACLTYGIEKYFKDGSQLAIIRRWKEDIIGKRASDIFNGINQNGVISKFSNGKYTGITYFASKFYVCNYDNNGKPIYNIDTDCIAYTFALSETEHNKSLSYPKINTILFDEFLTKHVYLNDEFVLFMNTLSTIIRDRKNVEIFMCGNTVNKFSPYFQEMGLTHIQKMNQGTIDIYSYGDSELKVAVEYCSSLERQKKNNYYFAFNNPKLKMITSGAWELDIFPHLPYKYKPHNIIFTYFIEFDFEKFQCEIISIDTNTMFTYIHKKTTEIKDTSNDLVYSLEYNPKFNYNRNIYKPTTKLQERILWFFKTDRVFYQNNETGNTIQNYLKICKGV